MLAEMSPSPAQMVDTCAPTTKTPRCRCCFAPLRLVMADLGMQPLCNAFLKPEDADHGEVFYPLRALVCESCMLVQAQQVESAAHIFTAEYPYFSSRSAGFLAQSRQYVASVTDRFGLGRENQVVEVACNDGYLLRWFLPKGIPVLGIEPTASTAAAARALGIDVRGCFFGAETARRLLQEGFAADLMPANNVAAHVPDLHDFIEGFRILLKPNGVATFEFHHLLNLIRYRQFDTIYHEHFYYHSLATFSRILGEHGLEVFDVDELPSHGGSLRVYAQRRETGIHARSPAVDRILAAERDHGLFQPETFNGFDEACRKAKRQVLSFLIQAKEEGKHIAACGAAAKGNTLLNYCGVRSDFIDYVVDDTPWKQGRLLPGTHIPVVDARKLEVTKPDYLLILPWNWREELSDRFGTIRSWGGLFVTLIPNLSIF